MEKLVLLLLLSPTPKTDFCQQVIEEQQVQSQVLFFFWAKLDFVRSFLEKDSQNFKRGRPSGYSLFFGLFCRRQTGSSSLSSWM